MKDPCRRYAFGMAVEGLYMRLYFFSRSFVVASKRFSIHTVGRLMDERSIY
jgi:hypothetical protein